MSIEGSTGEDEIPLSGYELKAGTTVPPGVRSTGLSEEVSFATFFAIAIAIQIADCYGAFVRWLLVDATKLGCNYET